MDEIFAIILSVILSITAMVGFVLLFEAIDDSVESKKQREKEKQAVLDNLQKTFDFGDFCFDNGIIMLGDTKYICYYREVKHVKPERNPADPR